MAGDFLTKVNGEKSFEEVAEELGLTKRVANDIKESSLAIPGVSNPNSIAKWLFDDASNEGDISSIIDIDGSYYVARISSIQPEGLSDVEDVRPDIEGIILGEKKSKKLYAKMNDALGKSANADELASQLEITPVAIPAASFTNSNMPYVGQDRVITGTIFGLPVGGQSGIITGEKAVAVVYLNNDNQYEATDAKELKVQITDQSKQEIQQRSRQTIIDKGNVVDLRYRFYN